MLGWAPNCWAPDESPARRARLASKNETHGGKMSESFSTDLVPVSDRLEHDGSAVDHASARIRYRTLQRCGRSLWKDRSVDSEKHQDRKEQTFSAVHGPLRPPTRMPLRTMNGNGQAHATGFHAAIITHSSICPNRAETEYLGPTLETCLGAT